MPRPPRAELPEALLGAASAEFARLGLHGVSLSGIAARLGLTKGAVYLHFRSKLDLFLAALDRLEARRERERPRTGPGPLAEIQSLLRFRLSFGLRHPELRRLHEIVDIELREEVAGAVRDGLRAGQGRLRAELRPLLQRAARGGWLEVGDPAAEAFRLVASLEGTLSQHQTAPEEVASFCDPETLVEAWMAPLRPRRPKPRASQPETGREEGEDFQPAF